MQEMNSFGYWVLRRRKALDLTRKELARRVGCATETIKKIERDERRPSRQTAELLAKVLVVPPHERALFIQVARGERSVDRLPLVTQPLRPLAQDTYRTLPTLLTPFIGRENELATIDQLLNDPDCRLLTLVGPGGAGKSRTALRAAEDKIGCFGDGILLVPLAGVERADILPGAIMNALDLKLEGQVRSHLIHYLREMESELLLVLDNFEQLLEGTDLLIEILQNTQRVKILVTSRERLNVQCEWVVPIQGLPFPSTGQADRIEEYPAGKLFVQTAKRVRTDFVLNEADQVFVARICELVEGMPLAIELVASWTQTLSCQAITHEIENGIDILTSNVRCVPERHRNMRSVFDHSWKLLTEEEQCVLKKLSVFRGGFSREVAQQVAGASLAVLSALFDKSLLHRDGQANQSIRYDLHELIRRYAHNQLIESGHEIRQIRELHLDYFVGLAEQAEPQLHGPDNLIWIASLERDYGNLRAAFAWATNPTRGRNGEQSQRLVRALDWFWCMRGHIEEACQWAERALAQDSPNKLVRAKAVWVWGYLNFFHGDGDTARELLQQGVELCRQAGPSCKRDLGLALTYLGMEAEGRGKLDLAQAYHEESLGIRREIGDSWGMAQSLMNLGWMACQRGDFAQAEALTKAGLSVARRQGEPSQIAMLLGDLGWIIFLQGDVKRARSLFNESLAVCHALRWQWLAAKVFENLGILEASQPEVDRLAKAARLWGVTEMLYKVWGSMYRLEESQREIAAAREQLGEKEFSIAWSEGQKLTFDQALAHALQD